MLHSLRRILAISLLVALHAAIPSALARVWDNAWSPQQRADVLVGITTAQVGLVAAWTSLSVTPWYFRWPIIAPLLVVFAPWAPTSSQWRENVAFWIIVGLCVTMPVWSLREVGLRIVVPRHGSCAGGSRKWQFSIRFALVWIAAAGTLLLSAKVLYVAYWERGGWFNELARLILSWYIGVGVTAGVLTPICLWFALGRGRCGWRSALAAVIATGAAFIPLAALALQPFDINTKTLPLWLSGAVATATVIALTLLISFLILRLVGFRLTWAAHVGKADAPQQPQKADDRSPNEILASPPDGP
ncbi:MAG: hypothetical protein HYS13_09265 [Planctomycetia bacterium]|nr:hypothetical protein [Planctomycetia bacterium]